MYYFDLAIQFVAKMTLQAVPYLGIMFILLVTITALKKDTKWLRKAIDKLYI